MTEIIGVRFKSGGKQYYFDPQGLTVAKGQGVIVETGKGMEYGVCTRPNGFVEDTAVVQPLRPVLRIATPEDEQIVADNVMKERKAMRICQEKIEKHQLDMKLVQVDYAFDGSKILFFFTSEGRVDFRALVKDLASVFHARIELRQIGVRDEARMLGGLGICGKPFCCSQFLNEFQPVSIKMAKTQNLSLNPTKISGTCGRLMCCLKYEQGAYEDAVKRCPKNDSFVECPDGVGNISSVNLLREQVKVKLEDSSDPPKTYRTSEIRVVRSGKGKRPEDYVAPPKEELEKLRFIPEETGTPLQASGNSRLSAALASIFNHEVPAAQPEEPRNEGGGRRRRRGQGERKSGGERQPAEKKAERRAPAEKKGGGEKKPRPEKKAVPAQPQPDQTPKGERAGGQGSGKKSGSSRRPRHRRPRPKAAPGESGQPKSESQ